MASWSANSGVGTTLGRAVENCRRDLIIPRSSAAEHVHFFMLGGGPKSGRIEVLAMVAGLLAVMTVLIIGFSEGGVGFFRSSTEIERSYGLVALLFSLWGGRPIFGLRFLHAGFAISAPVPMRELMSGPSHRFLARGSAKPRFASDIARANTLLPSAK